MRFTLYYDGPLPSAASDSRVEDKHLIRTKLHWQILQLFRDHPELPRPLNGSDWANWPRWEYPAVGFEGHQAPGWLEHEAVVNIGDLHFMPLVRESLKLICELDILFLRPGRPGLMERGARYDIDNRLLTLFDGLTLPAEGKQREFAIADQTLTRTSPIFCLLGDDSRITAINVRTDSLLTAAENAKPDHVRLVIGVVIRATAMSWENLGLASV